MPFPYPTLRFAPLLLAGWLLCVCQSPAAEVRLIYPELEPSISGKEVDWIYGDYLMQNDRITAIIAAPVPTRDANLTVRGIGGAVIDLTLHEPSNDQLSAFIPGGARYLFQDPSLVEVGKDEEGVFWKCGSSQTTTNDGTTATVTYRLKDGEAFLTSTVEIHGSRPENFTAYDGIRADRTFEYKQTDSFAYCADDFFRQAIGFSTPGDAPSPSWKKDRMSQLRYADAATEKAAEQLSWTVRLHPATSLLDLQGALAGGMLRTLQVSSDLRPNDPTQSVMRATLQITREDEPRLTGKLHTDDQGNAQVRLPNGNYQIATSAIGYAAREVSLELDDSNDEIALTWQQASGFNANVVDQDGNPIPVKATIYAVEGTTPDFGPDSTRTFIKNCVYAVHGTFHCPLPAGKYEVYFSHGPEYDAVVKQIEVTDQQFAEVDVVLPRVVDTTGWVSAELHSHSSPSGDNTSDQYGRVENLLCEHLEFAPCTEHARVSSYVPHLQAMALEHLMATCSGMELTGSPLPMNHQNAFPLHHHPHTQNGGGPRTDANPVVQIERLAMWDNGSEKVVQQNHPNIHQIFGDVDTDGIPDSGFRGMFQWMDVIEVHPLEIIFEDIARNPPQTRDMRIPIFQWMQLLNQGIRIPGVVNTDAHYNHHGSGWLRNWFASSTDDPSKIDIHEMTHAAEDGHIIMSTGPFLRVTAASPTNDHLAIPGDDLAINGPGKVTMNVQVQCPNWLDVNRVQVFVNGRPLEELNRPRRSHPDLFGAANEVVKFEGKFAIPIETDAHLIVATIGEGLNMAKVMGETYGNRPPVAVSNPIFIDTNGDGFTPNGDELGVPLPRQNR